MAVCHYHRDRPGVGICVRCRVVICAECSTRLDGINHCHACLKALGQRKGPTSSGRASVNLFAGIVLGLVWLLFLGIAWLMEGLWTP